MNQSYTPEELKLIRAAKSYDEMLLVVQKVLGRMPKPIIQVCGPISTGGKGSIEANMEEMKKVIMRLEAEGHHVFNQVPFEKPLSRISEIESVKNYPMRALEEFYLPIFKNRLIQRLFFMNDWQSSFGASWEHEQAKQLGIEIVYLQPDNNLIE